MHRGVSVLLYRVLRARADGNVVPSLLVQMRMCFT